MIDTYKDRKRKKGEREVFLNAAGRKIKCYLTLPGPTLEDIKLGMENGRFDENTMFIIAERDLETAEKIRALLPSVIGNCKYYLHVGELFDIDLTKFPKIDLAYADFTGNITMEELYWIINTLRPNLTRNATVVITHAADRHGMVNRLGKMLNAKRPMHAANLQQRTSDMFGEALTTQQAIAYDLLKTALVYTKAPWIGRYSDGFPMAVYGFYMDTPTTQVGACLRKLEKLEQEHDDYVASNRSANDNVSANMHINRHSTKSRVA